MATPLYDFDPDTLTASVGSAIATLADAQGSGLSLAQVTSGSRPILANTHASGRPSLHSDGSAWMATGTFSTLPAGSCIFLVVQTVHTGGNQALLSWTGGFAIYSDGIAFFSANTSTPYGYRIPRATSTYVVELYSNGSSSELLINGTLAYRGAISNIASIAALGIFSNSPGGFAFGQQGDFLRMRVFSAPTAADRKVERRYLASLYQAVLDESADVRFATTTGTLPTSASAYRIHASPNYSAGVPAVVGVFFHGSGGDPSLLYGKMGMGDANDAFLSTGGIVAAFQLQNTYDQTHLQQSLTAANEFLAYLAANYNVKCFVLMGESRGGVPSLVTLANTASCKGWIGLYAACDGAAWWSVTDPTLDPLQIAASSYAGKYLQFNASPADGTVSKTSNSDAMYVRVQGNSDEREDVSCTGGHGDISHFGYARTLNLIQRLAGLPFTNPGANPAAPAAVGGGGGSVIGSSIVIPARQVA